MSRYDFRGKNRRYKIIVGYDPSLRSLFAQVEDLAFETHGAVVNEDAPIGDSYEEGLIVWVGATTRITDVQRISKAVADYGVIPKDIEQRLRAEQ
jgi:glucose-6-phosphate isomerase